MTTAYLGLEAALHDAFWAAEGSPAELPLLERFLGEFPGPALEIGCGSGRLLLPLLAAGHPLEGLDNSPEMLGLCRAAAARAGLAPVLHSGTMEEFVPPSRFNAVVVPAFTLQIAADTGAVLARIAAMLEPRGGLFTTTFRPEAELAGELPERRWYEDHRTTLGDGSQAVVDTRHTLDRTRRILDRRHRYRVIDTDGTVTASHESRHWLRWFGPGALDRLLAGAGFTVTRRIADFDPAAPCDDPQILTLHAQLA